MSLQNDRPLLEELAIKYNTTVGRIYKDEGKSAYKGDHLKGELGELLKDIDNNTIKPHDIIVMRHLDRLSRLDFENSMELFNSILSKGIEIYTTMDNHLYSNAVDNQTKAMNNALVGFAFATANEESARKSYYINRNAQAQVNRFLDGERTPCGYPYDIGVGHHPFYITTKTTEGTTRKNPPVRQHSENWIIAKDLVQYGLKNGLGRCQNFLEGKGLKYTKQGIRDILSSPALFGCLEISLQHEKPIKLNGYYSFNGETICTEAEYYQLQHSRKKSKSNGNRQSYTLLAGKRFLFCGDCGSPLSANHSTGKGAVYYTCINHKCLLSEQIYTLDHIVVNALSHLLLAESDIDDSKLISLKQELISKTELFNTKQKLVFDNPESFGDFAKLELIKLNQNISDLEVKLAEEKQKVLLTSGSRKTLDDIKSWGDDKEKIINGDSESKRENGEKIAKLVNNITIYKDGLINITLIDNKSIYYYLPEQMKQTGRRLGYNLIIIEPDDKNYQSMKSDEHFKMITFTEDEVKNNAYRCNIESIHPDFLRLYSEEHTRYTALDKFVNVLLEYEAKNGFFVFYKKFLLNDELISDKQWQSHKSLAKKDLIKKGWLYTISFTTQKGNDTKYLVICRSKIEKQLPKIQQWIGANKILDCSLLKY